jgi:glycosyltransferase involved in cell wall biosynthesis
MSHISYSIVIPVYNSEKTLLQLHKRVDNVFKSINRTYELICVDDHSTDASWNVLKALNKYHANIKIVRLSRNVGQHKALMCGFSIAGGAFIITMDDDLQNPPEEIPNLINIIENSGFDVVYGISRERSHSFIRKVGSKIYFCLMSSTFKGFPVSNFRVVRRHVIDAILTFSPSRPLIGALIIRVTEKIGSVTVRHDKRAKGKSTYTASKLIAHFVNGVLYNREIMRALMHRIPEKTGRVPQYIIEERDVHG